MQVLEQQGVWGVRGVGRDGGVWELDKFCDCYTLYVRNRHDFLSTLVFHGFGGILPRSLGLRQEVSARFPQARDSQGSGSARLLFKQQQQLQCQRRRIYSNKIRFSVRAARPCSLWGRALASSSSQLPGRTVSASTRRLTRGLFCWSLVWNEIR